MDTTPFQPDTATDPAAAFAELRGEVSLLRRAVEGLTAERQNTPDYTPTLTEHSRRLARVEESIGAIADSPAMRLTPENLATSIAKASEAAREGDRETIRQAGTTIATSIVSINGVVEQAWAADRQKRWLVGGAIAGLLFGIILWSALPGEIARALPSSWHVPEKMAARVLRRDIETAGQLMIQASMSHTHKATSQVGGDEKAKRDGT